MEIQKMPYLWAGLKSQLRHAHSLCAASNKGRNKEKTFFKNFSTTMDNLHAISCHTSQIAFLCATDAMNYMTYIAVLPRVLNTTLQ